MVTIIFQAIGIIKIKSLMRNDSSIKIIRTKTLNGIVGITGVYISRQSDTPAVGSSYLYIHQA